MNSRKWLRILTLSIFLIIPSATALETPAQQIFGPRPPNISRSPFSAPIPPLQRQTSIGIGSIGLAPNRKLPAISVLPRNAREFESIYGRKPTRVDISSMARARIQSRLTRQPGVELYPNARTSRGFDNYVRQSKSNTVILEGHNVNGQFYFADGVSRNLSDIDAFLKENGKQGIFLSCDAQQYVPNSPATTRKINYREARAIRGAIGKGITGGGRSSINNSSRFDTNRVRQDINRTERQLSRNSRLKKAAKVTAGGAAGGGALFLADRWGKRKKQ